MAIKIFTNDKISDPQKRFLVPPPWVPHFWFFLWVLQDLTFKVTKKDQK